MLALKILKGPSKVGQQISIEGNLVKIIGRASDVDLQLPSNGVSKKHCQIREVAGSRLEITDLGSSNGTFVNGLMIKKYLAKPGDIISLHDYLLQVEIQAPRLVVANDFAIGIDPNDMASMNSSSTPSPTTTDAELAAPQNFFERTIFPVADNLAKQADVRMLVLGFFVLWSLAIASLSVFPFADTSNIRIENQASEVAKLYARQLARINQPFIIEQTYQRLVSSLDQYPGQTPGVLSTMIIDGTNGQILSPPDLVGRSIANPETVAGMDLLKKMQNQNGFSKVDSRGVIHALAPIRVGVADPAAGGEIVSKVVAVAYVEMDATRANLKAADLVNSALSAVLIALLLGFVLVAMVYRWTEGSLVAMSENLEEIIASKSNALGTQTQWQTLQRISEQINTIASRTGSANAGNEEKSLEWAIATVESLPVAAGAFDESLVVVSWNQKMETVIGIRATMALGKDISSASRDIAFEGAIRDLAAQGFREPGIPQRKTLDFSGREHEIVLVYSEGAHLVTIVLTGDGS